MAFAISDLFSIKYIALLLLVLQNTLLIVLMRYSRHRTSSDGSTPLPLYAASTAVFMMEIVKFITCHGVILFENGNLSSYWKQLKEELTVIEIFRVSIPSLLYTVQNNLLYFALTHLDAATYQVCYQTKILTTAVFSVFLLKKKLSFLQWASLVLLTVGVSITQYPTSSPPPVASPSPDTDSSKTFIGFVAVMMAAVLSGFAGVYFEKILKNSRSSVWMRNIQMGMTSISLAYAGVYFSADSSQVLAHGFFYGYDSVVIAVILLQAVGGLVVAVVVKYADNILKGFAASFSLVTSLILCYFLLDDFVPTLTFFSGAFLVNLSMYLYSYTPSTPTNSLPLSPVATSTRSLSASSPHSSSASLSTDHP